MRRYLAPLCDRLGCRSVLAIGIDRSFSGHAGRGGSAPWDRRVRHAGADEWPGRGRGNVGRC